MLCSACQKLALLPKPHQCVNCPRFCDYKEQRWCSFCGAMKSICQVCAKPIEQNNEINTAANNSDIKNKEPVKNKTEKVHPFFGNKGGCRSCGH